MTSMLNRAEIVARLREIAALLELHGGNRFKVKAFHRGARSLEAAKVPIETLIENDGLEELPGVGVAIAKQVEELHRTGTSALLDSLREGLPRGVVELSQIGGIGLHALRTLHKELGIATVDDLRVAAEQGRLRTVKGFSEKKEAKILDAIGRYEKRGPELRLSDGLRLARSLADDLAESIAGVEQVDIAGALRRSMELAPDVKLVLTSKSPSSTIERAKKHPRFASVVDVTERSCLLRLPDGVRVELTACRPDARATTLVQATGDERHVEALRARGLDAHAESTRDEPELYAKLGLAFIPPELRDREDAIAIASQGKPIELVTAEDLRGFVHCHSTWSDGKHSIEQMARAAKERGATFITITDHSKTASYAGGLNLDRLERQWAEIEEVEAEVGIRILKGTEADILADGALDWPDEVLEKLDVVIASIHNRYKQDEDAMTRRILRAMRHPIFKIWGHPLGRLVPSRPPVPCRVEEILDALAESRGAIEISGDPYRMDLEPRWAKAASDRGLKFVLSVDAHSMPELDNIHIAAGLARRAGLHKHQVLNTEAAPTFVDLVRPTR